MAHNIRTHKITHTIVALVASVLVTGTVSLPAAAREAVDVPASTKVQDLAQDNVSSAGVGQTKQSAAPMNVPRVLLRPSFRRMTPTRWCRNHRHVCIQELVRRTMHRFKSGRMGKTHWTHKRTRRIRPTFTHEYRILCGPAAQTTRVQAYQCPATSAASGLLSPRQAWRRYHGHANCSYRWIHYVGQPNYRLICTDVPQSTFWETPDDPAKTFLRCEAIVLGVGTVGVLFAGPGALGYMGYGASACGVGYLFDKLVDW